MVIENQDVLELLKGAYDLHTHTEPSHFNRGLNDFELVEEASKYGMAGVMIKSHYSPTAERAILVNVRLKSDTKAYGGVALNWPVGGLNPYAVDANLKSGAKIIWLPTRDSSNSLKYGDMQGDFFKRPGISIYDDRGLIKKEIYEIMDIVKQYDAVLATGHISPEESIDICKLGISRKIKMVLTHPDWPRTAMPLSNQKELADLGVYIEKLWLNIAEKSVTPEYMSNTIKEIGPNHIYISTDRGQNGFEHPLEGYSKFITVLLNNKVSKRDIKIMSHAIPKEVLNIM